jgi:membrane protein involved in colicin uptake
MDETLFGLISIVLPAILVILLIWLVVRGRGRGEDGGGTTNPRDNPAYAEDERRRREEEDERRRGEGEDERRRREGTDDL